MPVKPLSPRIVERLKAQVKKAFELDSSGRIIYGHLGSLENIDPRRNLFPWVRENPRDTLEMGGRVRAYKIHRNFPGTREVVLKRTHAFNAEKTLKIISGLVSRHNSRFRNELYVLRQPSAYAVGPDLIAMSRTAFPTVQEILGGVGFGGRKILPSESGKRFFESLERQTGASRAELGLAFERFRKNLYSISEGAYPYLRKISEKNFLLLGFEGEKFVFMPLPDVY